MLTGGKAAWRGEKVLMEENGTYGASGVLFNGGKWYLRYFGCVVGLFVKSCRGFSVVEVI